LIESPLAMPTLAQAQADPAVLDRLPVDALVDLRQQIESLRVALDTALLRSISRAMGQRPPSAPSEADRLLTAEEVAEMAGVSKRWLYTRNSKLPFARKLSHRVVRYSEAGVRSWLAAKQI
jgi:predicted DNA-binding transcriptional regulator AlpA